VRLKALSSVSEIKGFIFCMRLKDLSSVSEIKGFISLTEDKAFNLTYRR
jgi:hypothetical protein